MNRGQSHQDQEGTQVPVIRSSKTTMKNPTQPPGRASKRRYRRGDLHPHRPDCFFYSYKDGKLVWLTASALAAHRRRTKNYRRNHTRVG